MSFRSLNEYVKVMAKKITPAIGTIEAPVIKEKVVVVHHCTQATVIGEMCGLLKQISAQIYGNGQKGLAATVPILSEKIEDMSSDINKLSVNVSAMMKYVYEDSGEKRATEKHKISAASWTAIISSIILSIGAIIVTIILKT
jgi:hypothetical protein